MGLGQLAADDGRAVGAEHLDGVRRACRPAGAATRRTRRCAARRPARRATTSAPSACAGRTPRSRTSPTAGRHRQRRRHRRRTGQAADRQAAVDARRHQPIARIADQRHPRVADQQDRRTRRDLGDQRRHPRRLVLVVQADHLACGFDGERLGQGAYPPGVLGGDHVGAAQRADQPCRRVRRLTERRGADEQSARLMRDSLRSPM